MNFALIDPIATSSKYYMDIYKPSAYIVLETRCDPNKIHKSIQMLGFDGYMVMENQGFVGGIGVAWKKVYISMEVCEKDDQFIHLFIQNQAGKKWHFTAIYASPSEARRIALWSCLKRIAENVQGAWVYGR
ncbi:unnamed protein product [Lathyrus sativus]|nr:unnamed protein product [Lathyrus sativus]